MLPEPLHPALVHFPIVLAFLIPVAGLYALFAIRRGAGSRRAWAPVAVLAVVLFLSAWGSVKTGQDQEDRVEDVVGDRTLHGHEEAAERFLIASGALAGLVALGLLGGRLGAIGRTSAVIGSLAAVAMVVQVGHSGGELVYEHGAAQAYVNTATPPGADGERSRASRDETEARRERGRSGAM